MRIVGGAWRGQSFVAPEGRSTRPTTDRMRESLASMILSARGLDLSGSSVLDAFAGSGGMGLELLSRGASHCTFCERDRKTAGIIRKNCASLCKVSSAWHVVVGDAQQLAGMSSLPGTPFDIVFLDPPYAMPVQEVARLVIELARVGKLTDDCIVVYERDATGDELDLTGFVALRTKRHGRTCVDMLRKDDVR